MIKTKDEFKQFIKDNIKNYLPEHYKDAAIYFEDVVKGGKSQEGMLIRNDNQNIVPRIIIDGVYDSYRKNENLNLAMKELVEIVGHSQKEAEKISLSNMKDNITLRIVNLKQNKNLLKEIPHKTQGDLLITYRWIANVNSEGIHSALIRNELMESLGMNVDELHKSALENTIRLFPPRIGSMQQMFLEKQVSIEDFQVDNNALIPMYVLSNKSLINGASTILYPGLLDKIAEKFGSNIYILPSSINEVIILSDKSDMSVKSLENMVKSANMELVDPEEKLSDHVFLYNKDNKSITMANNQGKDSNQEFVNFFFNQNSKHDTGYSFDEPGFEP